MLLAGVSTVGSLVLYLLVNLLYIVPGGVHLHLRHPATRHQD
jgi:hypothetical protein